MDKVLPNDYKRFIELLADDVIKFGLSYDITKEKFIKNGVEIFQQYQHLYDGEKYTGTDDDAQWMALQLLISSNCTIVLDWKWTRDDNFLPDLQSHVKGLKAGQFKADEINKGTGNISDIEINYEFKLDDKLFKDTMKYVALDDLLDTINVEFLEEKYNRTIVSLDTNGDYYALIVVYTDMFKKLVNSEIKSVLHYVLHNVSNLYKNSFGL